MESEKVKEIKESLQQEIHLTEYVDRAYSENVRLDLLKDVLTLINELESENERLSKELDSEWKDRRKAEEDLHKAQWNYKIGLGQSQSVNKKLKDRIAELEKEIEENAFYSKGYAQGIKNTYEVVVPDKLKQFAERLKERILSTPHILGGEGTIIDETLKEYVK